MEKILEQLAWDICEALTEQNDPKAYVLLKRLDNHCKKNKQIVRARIQEILAMFREHQAQQQAA